MVIIMNTKMRILELLEAHRGETISGEQLAELLHVSRNAIWKAMGELRGEGYQITAVTNKGYCLSQENDILSVQGIKPFLLPECQKYAECIHIYPSLRSTNQTAKEFAVAGAEHGTTVIADTQTDGRGRFDRSFFSPAGSGLYLSMVLHPDALHFQNKTAVTAFAAVAVCDAIEALSGQKPTIKWVNDIFLHGKKVCGILTEAVSDFESGRMQWIVLGIGLNIHTKAAAFPEDLQPLASSVYAEETTAALPNTRNRFAAEIINRILGKEYQFTEEVLFQKYKERLFILGKEILVLDGQSTYHAAALDIDALGHLIVKDQTGALHTLMSGEIRIQPVTGR